jgi:transposase-like protein
MSKEERAAYWQKLVQEQAESGVNAAAFCKDHQINPQRFYFWCRRFKDESNANKGTGAFLELVPSSKIQGSGIRIRLNERLSIELDRGFDPCTLRHAIDALCRKGSCWR